MLNNILILGTDSVGRFLASQFATSRMSSMEVFLLFANEKLLKIYAAKGSTIRYENYISRHNPVKISRSLPGCFFPEEKKEQIQLSLSNSGQSGHMKFNSLDDKHIDNLIVTDRGYQAVNVLKMYTQYMSKHTNVMFFNPIIGKIDKVTNALYGDNISDRPNLWMAMSTHSLRNNFGFSVKHLGSGDVRLCKCPRKGSFNKIVLKQEEVFPDDDQLPPSLSYLLNLPMLQSLYCPYKDVYMAQIEKTIVDCCLYPLIQFPSGDLSESVKQMVKDIIAECISVLSCLQRVKAFEKVDPTMFTVFRPERLYELVISTFKSIQVSSNKYRKHNNKDIYDMLNGEVQHNETIRVHSDVFYSNDLIVELGEKKNIPTAVNRTLVDLIQTQMDAKQYRSHIIR